MGLVWVVASILAGGCAGALLVVACRAWLRARSSARTPLAPIDPEELRAANRLATVGEVAASIAHEMGTPLAVVQVRAQMIAAGEVAPAELPAEAQVIVQQAQRMARMLRELLELAHPATPVKVPVDLAQLARQAASLLEPLARKRRVKLALDGEPPAMRVLGDFSKLLQILTNLTMNAIQSAPGGAVRLFAVAHRRARPPRGGPEADYRCVEVRDDGVGIADSIRPRLFDAFFTTKKEGEGIGLGLTVSNGIARDHQGWIGVESTPGRGSCFTLYLPPLAEAEA